MNCHMKCLPSIVLLLMIVGCATVDTRWQQATSTNTIQAYEAFLKRHPDSEYSAEAKNNIDSLHWHEAEATNTTQGFERYIRLHGNGKYVSEAKDNIDLLHWKEATTKGSVKAFERYLRYHPGGKYSSDALRRVELLQWENAKKSKSLSVYKAFLQKYPNSKFATQARDELKTFAKVVVEFPDKLKSKSSYYNIGGPVWVFRIVFREMNGVDATITKKKMVISGWDGRKWGDWGYERIFNSEPHNQGVVKVAIPAKGTGAYTSWVNSPGCDLCGGTMHLEYIGTDANGHNISVSTQFILEK